MSNTSISIIIRASGEQTQKILYNQINKQKKTEDDLIVLNEKVCFEKKLKQGFLKALDLDNDFTVFIDADILLKSNALKRIKIIAHQLDESALGFGLLLWDRFYDQPKFRGLHIYRTKHLKIALQYIPEEGEQLRPESFMKSKMLENGFEWKNNISRYVAGLHDYYQKPEDIYYKFLIRSKRSKDDIEILKKTLGENSKCNDCVMALKGLEDGAKMDKIENNKYLYTKKYAHLKTKPLNKTPSVNLIILKNLYERYGFRNIFWKSL